MISASAQQKNIFLDYFTVSTWRQSYPMTIMYFFFFLYYISFLRHKTLLYCIHFTFCIRFRFQQHLWMNQIIVSVQFLARKYATNHNYHMHRCLPNTTVKHWPSWSISIKIGCDIFLGEIHLLNSMCDKMLTIIMFLKHFFLILRVSLKDVL